MVKNFTLTLILGIMFFSLLMGGEVLIGENNINLYSLINLILSAILVLTPTSYYAKPKLLVTALNAFICTGILLYEPNRYLLVDYNSFYLNWFYCLALIPIYGILLLKKDQEDFNN